MLNMERGFLNPNDTLYKTLHSYDFDKDKRFQEGWKTIVKTLSPDQSCDLDHQLLKAKVFFYSRFFHPVSLSEYQVWLHNHTEPQRKKSDDCDGVIKHNDVDSDSHPNHHPVSANDSFTDEMKMTRVSEELGILIGKEETKQLHNAEIDTGSKNENKQNPRVVDVTNQDQAKTVVTHTDFKLNHTQSVVVETSGADNNTDSETDSEKEPKLPKQQCKTDSLHVAQADDEVAYKDAASEDSPLSLSDIMKYVEKGEPIPGVIELNIQPTNEAPAQSKETRIKKPWEN